MQLTPDGQEMGKSVSKPTGEAVLAATHGSEMALLQRVLGAWYIGVKTWQMTHDSIPTAFASLAHVMDEVQTRVKNNSPNDKLTDAGGLERPN